MSIYDILMLIVFGGAILFGMWKGLSWQIASLAAIFVSYFVAMAFRNQLAEFISASEPWNQFAAMAILYLGTSLIIWTIYGYVRRSIDDYKLNGFDRQAGALLGALKGAILCLLATLFSVSLFGNTVREWVIESKSGGYIAATINRLDSIIPNEIHDFLDEHIKKFNENLNEAEPGFGAKSDAKLADIAGRLKIVTGKWQSSPVEHNQFGTSNSLSQQTQFGSEQVNYDANPAEQGGQPNNSFNQLKDSLRKDAGNLVDRYGRAIRTELQGATDEGISTGNDRIRKGFDSLFAPRRDK